MSEVMTRLREEHRNIAKLLTALECQLAIVDAAEQPDYDVLAAIAAYFVGFPDRCHHPKEDLIYGVLRSRDPVLAAEVGDLEEEHRGLAELTRSLAELIERALAEEPVGRDQVRDLTRDFIRRYRHHIAREELHVFPAARQVLSDRDWAEIDGKLGDRDDPLFGEVVADYFHALRDDIDSLAAIAKGD